MKPIEFVEQIDRALSAGATLREIEDYLDWLENTSQGPHPAELSAAAVGAVPVRASLLRPGLADAH